MFRYALCTLALLAAAPLHAQNYPTKPVRLIVPWSAGSGTDLMSRSLAAKVGEALGQPLIVDNRGGAGAVIGSELAAKSPPDGYTAYIGGSVSMAISPLLYGKVGYDPVKDFAPVSLAAIGPNLLVVHPSLPVRSVKDLIALAAARPGQLQFASPGAGSVQHIAGEMFNLRARVRMLHVPYKGSGQSIIDLISGQVHMDFDSIPPVLPHVRSGRLRPIAVTSEKRFSLLPEIPTIAEGGLPGFDMSTWWGLVAPGGVGKDVVARLHAETAKLLRQADVKEKLANVGADPVGNTPEEFGAFIRAERAKYAKVVKDAQIKLD